MNSQPSSLGPGEIACANKAAEIAAHWCADTGTDPDDPAALDLAMHLTASLQVIGRTGARNAEIGYDDDREPTTWWAKAGYRGDRLYVEGHPDPATAADALVAGLLNGGTCTACGRHVTNVRALRSRTDLCYWSKPDGIFWQSECRTPARQNRRRRRNR